MKGVELAWHPTQTAEYLLYDLLTRIHVEGFPGFCVCPRQGGKKKPKPGTGPVCDALIEFCKCSGGATSSTVFHSLFRF